MAARQRRGVVQAKDRAARYGWASELRADIDRQLGALTFRPEVLLDGDDLVCEDARAANEEDCRITPALIELLLADIDDARLRRLADRVLGMERTVFYGGVVVMANVPLEVLET